MWTSATRARRTWSGKVKPWNCAEGVKSPRKFTKKDCPQRGPARNIYRCFLNGLTEQSPTILRHQLEQKLSVSSEQISDQLDDYYKSHPDLMEYTLQVELPRMDYALRLPSGDVVMDREYMVKYARDQRNPGHILWRAANQSLCADATRVVLSEIQSMFFQQNSHAPPAGSLPLVSLAASHCIFVVDTVQNVVSSRCTLNVSLPSIQDTELTNVLSVEVVSSYLPSTGRIEMHCASVTPAPLSDSQVESIVAMCNEMSNLGLPPDNTRSTTTEQENHASRMQRLRDLESTMTKEIRGAKNTVGLELEHFLEHFGCYYG